MARRGRSSFLKREREIKKADKATRKRERREQRKNSTLPPGVEPVAEDVGVASQPHSDAEAPAGTAPR